MFSTGIESVVHENAGKATGDLHDAMCSTCEMTVIWMQNQLKQNQTQERILEYINEVSKPTFFDLLDILPSLTRGLLFSKLIIAAL